MAGKEIIRLCRQGICTPLAFACDLRLKCFKKRERGSHTKNMALQESKKLSELGTKFYFRKKGMSLCGTTAVFVLAEARTHKLFV